MAGEKLYGDQFVAFHSEYHINTDWRSITRDKTNGYFEDIARKGYCRFSFYEKKLYFIWNKNVNEVDAVVEIDVERKQFHIYKIDTKEAYEFVAVNGTGIFLYNTQKISLYKRNGSELSHVSTYKFGQKSYVECVYILGYYVFYSETLTANCQKSIKILDVRNGDVRTVWESHQNDIDLDDQFRRAYGDKRGSDKNAVKFASSAKKASCEFLYANEKRIIAGYTGGRYGDTQISYIIDINFQKAEWRVMEAFATAFRYYTLTGHQVVPHVFSFDMQQDAVWVRQEPKSSDKLNGAELCRLPIDDYPRMNGSNTSFYIPESLNFEKLYFDGQYAYELATNCLYRLVDGQEQKLDLHYIPYYDFWCWGDTYRVPSPACDKTVELKGYVQVKLNHNTIENAITRQSSPKPSEPVREKIERKPVKAETNNCQLTLGQFRELAPQLVGGRDELLEYRKSLPQKWDYNAFVGILLGLHARKVGDAASANFAFGQGDNNKSVDKKFDENGLWDIFNKYKKCDGNVRLSQVEDEIVAYVPEYRAIREKFDTVLQRLLKDAGM